MLICIYIVSAVHSVINFVNFTVERKSNDLVKGFVAFIMAFVFCILQTQQILNHEVEFTVMNLFAMTGLIGFQCGLWMSIFHSKTEDLFENISTFLLVALVAACIIWWCFAAQFH